MQDAARAWDEHAPTYATLFAPLTGFIARAMLTATETRLSRDARILDVACGSGALAIPAMQRATQRGEGHVVASDFSPAMVKLTAEAARALAIPVARHRCETQNGEALSYPDAEFDAVFSCFGIFLFADRQAGWREAARVLKPGGTFATTTWQGPETNTMLREQITPIMAALPEHLRPTQRASWMEVADGRSLAAEIEGTGAFTGVGVWPFHATIVLCPWQRAWDALRNNPVMGALLARCSPAELEAVRESFFSHLRGLAGGDDAPLLLDSACNILVATRK